MSRKLIQYIIQTKKNRRQFILEDAKKKEGKQKAKIDAERPTRKAKETIINGKVIDI